MSDYIAWLVEINEAVSGPLYYQMEDDNDWTVSHDKALHFARKQDAEHVINYYGWTRAKATEHCWPEPIERKVVAESNGHHWIEAFNLTCCRDCGIVRRADDQNKPCRGIVGIALRNRQPTDAPAHPAPTSHLEKAQMKIKRKPR